MTADPFAFRTVPSGAPRFVTTSWTLVLSAGLGQGDAERSRRALATLCEMYWYPLYLYVRRGGYAPEDAEDLTQGFLARLLEKNGIAAARSERGRFRSFLLSSLKHYVANEWRRGQAAKRGGGRRPLALDGVPRVDGRQAEARYRHEPAHDLTPERVFDRRWGLTLLEHVLSALRGRYAAEGKSLLFDRLEGVLAGDNPHVSYAQIAADLGASEGAIKVAAHRLRRRYRELLRAAIAETVESPEQVEDEIRALFQALDA